MNDERNISSCSFDEMPSIVADLVGQVKVLSDKIDGLVKNDESPKQKCENRRTMRIEEVSQMLGVKRGTLYHLTSLRQIPCYKAGRRLVFFEDEIVEWLKNRRRQTDLDALGRADDYLSCHF